MKKNVVIVKTDKYEYYKDAPFRPSSKYPEYIWTNDLSTTDNNIYEMVREGFYLSKYDINNYGTDKWNPLGEFISYGDSVLIKPNMVMDENHIKENGTDCLFTHPSLVATVVDYVIIALKGKGKIVVGDAPMQECDFEALINNSGYNKLIDFYREKLNGTDIIIELADFRGLKSERINGVNHSFECNVKGSIIDLKDESEFAGESKNFYENMRITNYDPALLKQHHNANKNEYFVNDYVLKADVIINMPKPKTHRKAGVTISMKNLVGINCRKEYLPHHANGALKDGGDEYLNRSFLKHTLDKICDKRNYYAQTKKAYKRVWLLNKLYRIVYELIKLTAKDDYYEGSWYGNDTISRTIVDLNKILFYVDKNGIIQNDKQRNYLIIADMIISGEKEGPVAPSPKNVGVIAMGDDPVCFDEAILELMGAKVEYIHTISHARNPKGTIRITEQNSFPFLISNDIRWNKKCLNQLEYNDLLHFVPTSGWKEAFKRQKNN
jgi:uncharacterized protein (DUF362 family)